MRVMLFTHTAMPPRFGTERVVDSLGRGFAAIGVETTVVCCGIQDSLEGFTPPYRFVVLERGRIRFFRKPALKRQLARVLDGGFDVVHGHGARPEGEWLLQMKNRHNASVVLTCHRPLEKAERGDGEEGPHLSRRGSAKRLGKRRKALAGADAVVALSPSMKESIASFCGRGDHVHVIPNGIPAGPPESTDALLPAGLRSNRYLLGMGRLDREKGFDLLIRAFSRVFGADFADGSARGDRDDMALVIAGEGPEEEKLCELAASLGLAERVLFAGYVKEPVKAALFKNSLFLVAPSRVPETFGLVVVESFSAGRTVVGAGIGGIGDIIKDSENGLLFRADDEEDLAGRIRLLSDDGSLRKDLEKGAKDSLSEYSWDKICRRHIALYTACIEAGKKKRK